jgi:cytochrome c biogenesis protein CcdA
MARGGGAFLFFLVYLVLGLYFINFGINFIKIPTFFTSIDKWIIFAGGILLIFGGINSLRMSRFSSIRSNVR